MFFFIKNFALSFGAVAFFAVMFQCPKKLIWMCGVSGAVAWCSYMYASHVCYHDVGAVLFASIVLSIIAGIFAVVCKKPLPVFLATGVLPLVPGVKLFRGVSDLLLESGKYESGMKTLMSAGRDAIAIALGIMIGTSIFSQFLKMRRLRKEKQAD